MKKIEFYHNRNIIYEQLKKARKKAGLTQGQLAAKMQVMNINVDQQTISKIEKNMRLVTDYELAAFCRILKIDGKELLSDYYTDYET